VLLAIVDFPVRSAPASPFDRVADIVFIPRSCACRERTQRPVSTSSMQRASARVRDHHAVHVLAMCSGRSSSIRPLISVCMILAWDIVLGLGTNRRTRMGLDAQHAAQAITSSMGAALPGAMIFTCRSAIF